MAGTLIATSPARRYSAGTSFTHRYTGGGEASRLCVVMVIAVVVIMGALCDPAAATRITISGTTPVRSYTVSRAAMPAGNDVTVSWSAVTRRPGIVMRLYRTTAGTPPVLLTEQPTQLGMASYHYIDKQAGLNGPAEYHLSYCDLSSGGETVLATLLCAGPLLQEGPQQATLSSSSNLGAIPVPPELALPCSDRWTQEPSALATGLDPDPIWRPPRRRG